MRVLIAAVLLSASAGYANQEITAELRGGTTMEMVRIEPGPIVAFLCTIQM